MRLVLLSSLLSMALTGCVTTSFRPEKTLGARQADPIDSASVRVLTPPVDEPYEVLGEIEADVTGFMTDEAILAKVRERAAHAGANAVLHTGPDVLRTPIRSWPLVGSTPIRRPGDVHAVLNPFDRTTHVVPWGDEPDLNARERTRKRVVARFLAVRVQAEE